MISDHGRLNGAVESGTEKPREQANVVTCAMIKVRCKLRGVRKRVRRILVKNQKRP
jgi:hypothetical protein